ncbi:hypothetical protein FLONG3_9527 [Fusarium longipes]|uniref:Uncharacterized protein n=1 Tax=Fusarium longipes TaxID=694270 RepID=A0A395RXC8_9HYPO|nr:hypothetical protein FLONG3_9527 [Fusarium longipes]
MATDEQSPEEVSGQTAFWILMSLAAAAVFLPTTSSRMKGRQLFGGNIDLMRSIPGVCLVDGICDTIFIGMRTYEALKTDCTAQRARRALPNASVVAAKLMLSVFTVFPQTIKAFSLKGVPATQFCAFIFFYAYTTRLLIDLCGLEYDEPFTPTDDQYITLDIIVFLGLTFQQPFQLWIWHNIAQSIKFRVSENFESFYIFLHFGLTMLLMMQLIIWLLYLASRRRFDLSASIYVVPIRTIWLFMVISGHWRKLSDHEERQNKAMDWINRANRSMGSMFCALFLSSIVAKLLDLIGRLIVAQINTPEIPEGPAEVGDGEVKDNGRGEGEEAVNEKPTVKATAGWIGRLGGILDRWAVRFVFMHSNASFSITWTVFNLTTTIMYYLVYFDGTGTVNPKWTSVLG